MRPVEILLIAGCAFVIAIMLILQIISLMTESIWKEEIFQIKRIKKLLQNFTYLATLITNLVMIIVSLLMEIDCSVCHFAYEMYRDLYVIERALTYIFFVWRCVIISVMCS